LFARIEMLDGGSDLRRIEPKVGHHGARGGYFAL